MITRVPSKSSKSSGFNLILQKFYKMICEIIVSKLWVEFSWFFVDRVLLIILWWKQFFGIKKSVKVKYLETHLFLKNFCTPFRRSYPYKSAGRIFFFKKCFFQGLGVFFTTATRLILASFFPQKNNFILFFKGDYLILI